MTLLTSELLPTKTYPFSVLRHQTARDPAQEGVWAATDFLVSQKAGGATMSVDIAAGDAWVQGDDAVRQGLYHQVNDATVNVAVAANASGNPRIDQVILQMADSSVIGASDAPQLLVVQGTPTAGATLDNRTGAAALPNTAERLADILVANAAASIVNANIRDRRAWARGAYYIVSAAAGYTLAAADGVYREVDAATFSPRIECVGVPLEVDVYARMTNSISTADTDLEVFLDGLDTAVNRRHTYRPSASGGGADNACIANFCFTPSAGSHKVQLFAAAGGGGTATIAASAANPIVMAIREQTRQNIADNPAGYG